MRNTTPIAALFGLLLAATGCTESGLSSVVLPDSGEEDTALPQDTGTPDTDSPADTDTPIAEPIADAGPDRIIDTGSSLSLDGTSSYDPAGLAPLQYEWELIQAPAGSIAKLSSYDVSSPSFTADVDGDYIFSLVVGNSMGVWDSTPDKVKVSAELDPVIEPVANAGPDQVTDEGNLVFLTGAASFDPSGLSPLSYQWHISTRPAGSGAALSSATSMTPNFTADVPGTYAVELTVQNSAGVWDSTPDAMTVTVNEIVIAPPIANAGSDQTVDEGSLVFVSGNASYDPAGLNPLQYQWTLLSKPSGSSAFLLTPGSVVSTFIADRAGDYVLQLGVANSAGIWDPTPDTVTIHAEVPPASEPIADAGNDQAVQPLDTVFLDASGSYDPGGMSITNYQWTLVSRPSGSTTSLSTTTGSNPSFFADLAGDYVFDLTVRNSAGLWDSTPDQVIVNAAPADGFYVEVSWDNVNDLDLHIVQNGYGIWNWPQDCNFCNLNPNWGGSGGLDDPSLDWDAIYGWGPETTTIDAPASGAYDVKVHYYGQDGASSCAFGCPSSTATVKVFLGGSLARTYTRTMHDAGQVWNVATITWPSGLISTSDTITTTSDSWCY